MSARDCIDCMIVTHPDCPHCHELISRMPGEIRKLMTVIGVRIASLEVEQWLLDLIKEPALDKDGFLGFSAYTPTLLCLDPTGRVVVRRVLGSPPSEKEEERKFWAGVRIAIQALGHLNLCYKRRKERKKKKGEGEE